MSDFPVLPPLPSPVSIDALALVADAVIVADAHGRVVLFNRAAEESFGYAAGEVLGNPLEMLLPERHRASHADHVRTFAVEHGAAMRLMGHRREVQGRRKNGEEFSAEAMLSRHTIDGRTFLTVVHRDITERKAVERHRETIARELDHRTRNVLSVVNALVLLSARDATSVAEFKDSLIGRLNSVAATQTILGFGAGQITSLEPLLQAELDQYRTSGNVNLVIGEPPIVVGAIPAQSLALIFHELATNAAKYGALSAPGGRITVTSEFSADGSKYQIEWREIGGPMVTPPERQGFGTAFIKKVAIATFGADAEIEYPPEGVVCRLTLPRDKVEAV